MNHRKIQAITAAVILVAALDWPFCIGACPATLCIVKACDTTYPKAPPQSPQLNTPTPPKGMP